MNSLLMNLQDYPFERLAALKAGAIPPANLKHIALAIGEPKHAPPSFVLQVLRESLAGLSNYPTTAGTLELRSACARWLERRFILPVQAVQDSMVLPVNGTREALFSFAQAVINTQLENKKSSLKPLVVMPNPFYQIYEGATLLAGADPYCIDTPVTNSFLPDLDTVPAKVWERCQLLYLCSPGNPAGAIMDEAYLQHALELADRHDFLIAADECYAEIYFDEVRPPPSLLSAAYAAGRKNFERCVVFHSLSKRSSLPGLRSGFVAGDASVLKKFLLYRTYHGCAMPVPTQLASIAAWNDDAHVRQNRALYREKFNRVIPILSPHLEVQIPQGGFYLWPNLGREDTAFTRALFATQNVTILPGSFLARTPQTNKNTHYANPGAQRVRISLVAELDECIAAAHRMANFIQGHTL